VGLPLVRYPTQRAKIVSGRRERRINESGIEQTGLALRVTLTMPTSQLGAAAFDPPRLTLPCGTDWGVRRDPAREWPRCGLVRGPRASDYQAATKTSRAGGAAHRRKQGSCRPSTANRERATPRQSAARRGGRDARDPRRQPEHPRETPRANQETGSTRGPSDQEATPTAGRGIAEKDRSMSRGSSRQSSLSM